MISETGVDTPPHPSSSGVWATGRKLVNFLRSNRELTAGAWLTGLLVIVLLMPQLFTPYSPTAVDPSQALAAPSFHHPFGTDEIGRDVLSRVVWGTRVTLGMVSLALSIPALLGMILGLLAGYYRGSIDTIVSRFADLLLSFPSMITAVIITGVLGPGIRNGVLALVVVYIPMFFRVARSATLAEANLTYVEAANALGVRRPTTLFKHISRNIVKQVIIQFTVLFPAAIQIAAALGFLGLGVQPPTPEWGAILNQGKNYLFNAPWISVFPGVAIVWSALALTLLGRGLQRALDAASR
ncbi:MAG TPA: ABC transporter permease [Trueperaceae bacterium]